MSRTNKIDLGRSSSIKHTLRDIEISLKTCYTWQVSLYSTGDFDYIIENKEKVGYVFT